MLGSKKLEDKKKYAEREGEKKKNQHKIVLKRKDDDKSLNLFSPVRLLS